MTSTPEFDSAVRLAESRLVGLGGIRTSTPAPPRADHHLIYIGTLAGLPVWCMQGSSSEVLAAGRRTARGGHLGLIWGVDGAVSRWLLAVTLQPVRLAVVAMDDDGALVWNRCAHVARAPRPGRLEQAVALAEALDVDAAGRKTFRLLRGLLDRAVSLLPATVAHEDRHAWALAQVTRLLFLRFVESEGWLDGNPRFLAQAFDRCLIARRDPTRHLLQPLFFGTLNRPCEKRSTFARAFGAIPFLNGGLFEPHAIERTHALRLPAEFWCDAFAALVDRVEVTLDASSIDGRVTPELLGRVFEGVMHPAERRDQGTYFTPPPLVNALLRQAIACHLAPRMHQSEECVEHALDDPDPGLLDRLLDITVLDPAVGSGAFLIGALALLHGPGPRDAGRVRRLVTRRLFGVDRHPVAVRICELRLWLEVLRTMRGRAPARVPPLPNLDATVRAGDGLIDAVAGGALPAAAARTLAATHRAIVAARGSDKRALLSELRELERRAIARCMDERENILEQRIIEVLDTARAPTLFGDRVRMAGVARRQLAALRRARRALRSERRRVLRGHAAAPFAVAAAFAPAMARRGGFDLVVGNPPWVRAERLTAAVRDALALRYRWWRSGSGTGWKHLPDLSVAFVERSYTLLAPGGTLALLVPAKLSTAGYAGTCRNAMAAAATIHRVADLADDPRAGFEATTYPLAIVASRRAAAADHAVRLGLAPQAPAQPQALWHDSAAWITASPEVQRIASRMAREHPRLSDQLRPQLGVKTGANSVFLDPPDELQAWSRPAVRGRDVHPFRARPGTRILWPADERGNPWDTLPPELAGHLRAHVSRLEQRADHHRGPWWRLFRTRAATALHRVVWRDLGSQLEAALLTDQRAVPLNTCYVAATPSAVAAESLVAWLNSNPVRALARAIAEPAAGGCARFAARAVGGVPLPAAALGHPVLASLTHAAANHPIQEALDDCVASLLGLSSGERDELRELATHRR